MGVDTKVLMLCMLPHGQRRELQSCLLVHLSSQQMPSPKRVEGQTCVHFRHDLFGDWPHYAPGVLIIPDGLPGQGQRHDFACILGASLLVLGQPDNRKA